MQSSRCEPSLRPKTSNKKKISFYLEKNKNKLKNLIRTSKFKFSLRGLTMLSFLLEANLFRPFFFLFFFYRFLINLLPLQISYQSRAVWIPLTGLAPPPFCAFHKPAPGFPASYGIIYVYITTDSSGLVHVLNKKSGEIKLVFWGPHFQSEMMR